MLGGQDPLLFGFSVYYSEADSLSNKPSSIALGGVPSLSTGGFTLGGSPTAARGGGGPGGAGGARRGAAAHALGDEEPHSRRSRTPAALHKFRESRLWSVLTHGANFDIHEVRAVVTLAVLRSSWVGGTPLALWHAAVAACTSEASEECERVRALLAHPFPVPLHRQTHSSVRASGLPMQVVDTDEKIASIHYHSER